MRAIAERWLQGAAPEEIQMGLPHVELKQVFPALHYYLSYRQEIGQYIAANRNPPEWSGKRFNPATGTVE